MKKLIYIIFMLFASGAAIANFAIFTTHLPTPVVMCNINTGIATGVGAGTCATSTAVCDGVTDDAAAFTSFNTWAVSTWQASHTGLIGLTWTGTCNIVTGTVKCGLLNANLSCPFINIKQLLVTGIGTAGLLSDHIISVAGFGLAQDNTHSARTITANSGDTCVTLITPANASIFTVGNYALMAGFDLQGFGFPPNPHYFDYVLVSSISTTLKCDGVTAGASVRFSNALTNTYKSTWPLYFAGSAFEADQGGPATLYYLDPSWNTEVEFRNLTMSRPTAQIYATGRSVTYRNDIFPDSGVRCPVPSQNSIWIAIDSTFTACNIEIDKIVGTVQFTRGSAHIINTQSSSINTMIITGTAVDILSGTPKRFISSGSTFGSFSPGATAYGRSDETICTSCVLTVVTTSGYEDKGVTDEGVNVSYTMSGGIITVPKTVGPPRWDVPGTNLFWVGAKESETAFRVLDITDDVTNTYVQTNLAGGFPGVPLTGGKLFLRVHPAPKFTCKTCTGSIDAIDLSQAIAAAPIYSYSSRPYTQATLTGNSATFPRLWGAVTSYGVNVTTAYAGVTNPLTLHPAAQFDNYATIKADYSQASYGPNINMRAAGNRVITGVTCPGAGCTGNQASDSGLGFPEAGVWFTGGMAPFISTDVSASGTFSVTITIQTDQGVVNP